MAITFHYRTLPRHLILCYHISSVFSIKFLKKFLSWIRNTYGYNRYIPQMYKRQTNNLMSYLGTYGVGMSQKKNFVKVSLRRNTYTIVYDFYLWLCWVEQVISKNFAIILSNLKKRNIFPEFHLQFLLFNTFYNVFCFKKNTNLSK